MKTKAKPALKSKAPADRARKSNPYPPKARGKDRDKSGARFHLDSVLARRDME